MNEKFNNKYRIPSARLLGYNYAWEGFYFITICTKDKEHFFGEIENEEMKLSLLGKQVIKEWLNTPSIRPDMNLELGEFVVMPNHFHAIIYIGKNEYNSIETQGVNNVETQGINNVKTQGINNVKTQGINNVKTQGINNVKTQGINNVETQCIASLQENGNEFKPQSKNLPSIIRGFKSSITTFARKNNINFSWQPRYYDRIIRDEKELNAISYYIINNPKNWEEDEYSTTI